MRQARVLGGPSARAALGGSLKPALAATQGDCWSTLMLPGCPVDKRGGPRQVRDTDEAWPSPTQGLLITSALRRLTQSLLTMLR